MFVLQAVDLANHAVKSVEAVVWSLMQWFAVRKYGMPLDAVSFNNVPEHS